MLRLSIDIFWLLNPSVSSFVFYADLAGVALAFTVEYIYFNRTFLVLVVIGVMIIILKQSRLKIKSIDRLHFHMQTYAYSLWILMLMCIKTADFLLTKYYWSFLIKKKKKKSWKLLIFQCTDLNCIGSLLITKTDKLLHDSGSWRLLEIFMIWMKATGNIFKPMLLAYCCLIFLLWLLSLYSVCLHPNILFLEVKSWWRSESNVLCAINQAHWNMVHRCWSLQSSSCLIVRLEGHGLSMCHCHLNVLHFCAALQTASQTGTNPA